MKSTHLRSNRLGFSLLETLAAMAITAGIAVAAFQLFHQNERLFRDQALILEMQQTARVVIAQIAEDIRRAGQAIPSGLADVILSGSGSTRLNLRASTSAVEATVVSPVPFPFTIGTASTIVLDTTFGISKGRQAFVWADRTWVRATIESVSAASHSVSLSPTVATSSSGFVVAPVFSLDEAVSVFWDGTTRTVRRTTASNTENPASPDWAPANELAANVTTLNFVYLDGTSRPVDPDTLESRSQVRAIEMRVVVRASALVSNGTRPTYGLSSRAVPRNLGLR